MVLLFCPDLAGLSRQFDPLAQRLSIAAALWVAWPTMSSGVVIDPTEAAMRDYGLAAGLVGVNICAIDATWSGLRFVRRLRDR